MIKWDCFKSKHFNICIILKLVWFLICFPNMDLAFKTKNYWRDQNLWQLNFLRIILTKSTSMLCISTRLWVLCKPKCFHAETNDFDQQTACSAPFRRSKYTTKLICALYQCDQFTYVFQCDNSTFLTTPIVQSIRSVQVRQFLK